MIGYIDLSIIYPLLFEHSHGFSMAVIEIDGLLNLKMVIFHGELLNSQRVYLSIILGIDF